MAETKPVGVSLTCLACRLVFTDTDIHKLHYKSDWHRYNLKRRVADLPPVTSEEFQRRVINQRTIDTQAQQKSNVYCNVCRKVFGNQNAFDNHLNSQKHKLNEKSFDPNVDKFVAGKTAGKDAEEKGKDNISVDPDIEEIDSDEWAESNSIDNNDCMFCTKHNNNFLKNLEHMTIVHSFFIPDIEYCSDIEGLLHYLSEKIDEGFMCLWCNEKGKTFHSADAARRHMEDKGHCKMIYEGIALAEYSDFYDYSSSYPDAESDDQEVSIPELNGSEYQLVLPSGVTVGHRSLMKYYKQSANPNKTVVVHKKSDKKLHKVLASYRALGWTALDQATAAKRVKDIHCMKRMQSKLYTKLGVKANKLQTHFRQQVNF